MAVNRYMNRFNEIECDSCGVPNDGDPIAFIGTGNTYGLTAPLKIKTLQEFWLCGECKVHYPAGAKDYFTEDFFDDTPYCAVCEVEEVESEGHVCDYCEDED